MRNTLRLAVALAALLPLAASAAERILIGESAPLTGSNAELGKDIRDGALAYFKKVNDAGGVNGKQIELKVLDDKNDRKAAAANAAKLVNEDNVVALFGFASATLSLDVMPLVKDKRVPFFAPFTGADATVMRPTDACAAMPVDCFHVAPSSAEYQTWPLSVSSESATFSPSVSTKPLPPVEAIDHTYGPVARPVLIATLPHDAPELVERYRP